MEEHDLGSDRKDSDHICRINLVMAAGALGVSALLTLGVKAKNYLEKCFSPDQNIDTQ